MPKKTLQVPEKHLYVSFQPFDGAKNPVFVSHRLIQVGKKSLNAAEVILDVVQRISDFGAGERKCREKDISLFINGQQCHRKRTLQIEK